MFLRLQINRWSGTYSAESVSAILSHWPFSVSSHYCTQCGPKVPGLNFLPLSYQRQMPGHDWTTQLKLFLTRVQIGISVVAVVVKTEHLALTVVVTLC